jgi:hypothetical protein
VVEAAINVSDRLAIRTNRPPGRSTQTLHLHPAAAALLPVGALLLVKTFMTMMLQGWDTVFMPRGMPSLLLVILLPMHILLLLLLLALWLLRLLLMVPGLLLLVVLLIGWLPVLLLLQLRQWLVPLGIGLFCCPLPTSTAGLLLLLVPPLLLRLCS